MLACGNQFSKHHLPTLVARHVGRYEDRCVHMSNSEGVTGMFSEAAHWQCPNFPCIL